MSNQPSRTDEIRTAFAATFDIERELVGGGMSRVFLATERALARRVVIKVLPPELAAGVNRDRFRQEVQLAAQLQHPHIVPLYAAGTHGDILYYTMPFIEGESLKNALQEKQGFTPREVLRIMHDVVDALGYAHARGVIHRDIKPGNVLRSAGHAVVTDFGVAKAISAAMPAHGMTTTGMAIGTPAYMAPEQLAGDPKADHRVDLYAVGLLAYELLTGEMPFAGASPQETMAAQLTRTPEPLDKVRKDVPAELSAAVMWCLAKRPEDRPQDAAQLLARLDTVPTSGEVAVKRDARPWIALGGAAAALAALVIWQKNQAPPTSPQVPRDTVTMSAAGPLLTRAESLAIAKAVAKKMEMQRAATPAPASPSAATSKAALDAELRKMADSIRDEIQRAVFDSLARVEAAAPRGDRGGRGGRGDTRTFAQRPGSALQFTGLSQELDSILGAAEAARRMAGRNAATMALDSTAFAKRAASMGPPRRVVVTDPRIYRGLEDATPSGAAIADSLRRALGATKRFVIVDKDTVRQALEKTRTVDDLAKILNADAFASITLMRLPNDSARWDVTIRDLTANSAYRIRSVVTHAGPLKGMPPGVDSVVALAAQRLQEMDKAPRRPAEPATPPRP